MNNEVKKRIEKEQENRTGQLDLGYLELTIIPAEIQSMDWLTHLNLNSTQVKVCLLYTSPSPRDATLSRMPSSA